MEFRFFISVQLLAAVAVFVESMPHYIEPIGSAGVNDFCENRRNGLYALGCIPQFIRCTNRMSSVMFCRHGLFFDEQMSKCLPKWSASSCHDHGYPRPPQGVPPHFDPVDPEESEFCAHRPDGNYNIGCTSCYITCADERAYAMECPAGLVLDEATNMCVAKMNVEVCSGTPTTTEPTTTTELTTTEPTTTEPTTAETTTVASDIPTTTPSMSCGFPHKPIFCCEGKPDGHYSLGCSSLYAVCIGGKTYMHKCSGHRRFDAAKEQCVEKDRAVITTMVCFLWDARDVSCPVSTVDQNTTTVSMASPSTKEDRTAILRYTAFT
ncbi:unnamed protein product [Toxocara canis]|uniref:Chondroitin proteoglycan 2 n=1 Tax=Toxocara canis TaxID=6265 RepID=A0A183UG75_TOXCA|nr:unnamed protein product [Toxocara canis]